MNAREPMQHVNDAQIDRLLNGESPAEESGRVEAHLNTCEQCAQRLTTVAGHPWGWGDVSQNLVDDEFDSPGGASNEVEAGAAAMLQREISGWLDPSDQPEMLGRFAGYEILGVIGHGGMGIVLKGFERALNRFVAIKVLAPRLASSDAARRRFEREARAAAAVLHDNVIAIHRVDQWHGLPFLVMPYVAGESLQDRLDREGPLAIEAVIRIGQQIAAGLAAAHAQGLVHRDIKPANILLGKGVERVTITDFGLARAADDAPLTRTGFVTGTPRFMSPEQASGEPIDHRSDLFSLGSVLYAMTTGQAPFQADENRSLLSKVREELAPDVCQQRSAAPVWLGELIDWCHAKSPQDRPAAAADVEQFLAESLAYLKQSQRLARPKGCVIPKLARRRTRQPASSRFWRWRRSLLIGFGGILLALAGIAIVLETRKGTIRIECEGDNVPLLVKKSGKEYDKLVVGRDGKSLRLFAGEYEIGFAGDFDAFSVDKESVSLKQGGRTVVRIRRAPAKSASSKQQEPTNPQTDKAERAYLREAVRAVVENYIQAAQESKVERAALLARDEDASPHYIQQWGRAWNSQQPKLEHAWVGPTDEAAVVVTQPMTLPWREDNEEATTRVAAFLLMHSTNGWRINDIDLWTVGSVQAYRDLFLSDDGFGGYTPAGQVLKKTWSYSHATGPHSEARLRDPKTHRTQPGSYTYHGNRDGRRAFHGEKLKGMACSVTANKGASVVGEYDDTQGTLFFVVHRNSAVRVTGRAEQVTVRLGQNSKLDLTHLQIGDGGVIVKSISDRSVFKCGETSGRMLIQSNAVTDGGVIRVAPNTPLAGEENVSADSRLVIEDEATWASRQQEFSPPIRKLPLLFDDTLWERRRTARAELKQAKNRDTDPEVLAKLQESLASIEGQYRQGNAAREIFRAIRNADASSPRASFSVPDSLWSEAIRLANESNITVDAAEIDAELKSRAEAAKLSLAEFLDQLSQGGSIEKYRNEVLRAELLMKKLAAHDDLKQKWLQRFARNSPNAFPGPFNPSSLAGVWIAEYFPLQVTIQFHSQGQCALVVRYQGSEFHTPGAWSVSASKQVMVSLPNLPDAFPESDMIFKGLNANEMNYGAMRFMRRGETANSKRGEKNDQTSPRRTPYSIEALVMGRGLAPTPNGVADVLVTARTPPRLEAGLREVLRKAPVATVVDPFPIKIRFRKVTVQLMLTEAEARRVRSYEHRHAFYIRPAHLPGNAARQSASNTAGNSRIIEKPPVAVDESSKDEHNEPPKMTAELAAQAEIQIVKTVDVVIPLSADFYTQKEMKQRLGKDDLSVIVLPGQGSAGAGSVAEAEFAHLCRLRGYSSAMLNSHPIFLARLVVPIECRLGEKSFSQRVSQNRIGQLLERGMVFQFQDASK